MSTFNRRRITSLCLAQLKKTKGKDIKIQCWDAGSTEYTTQDLYEWGADEVYKSLFHVNDGQNRAIQLTHFINKEKDELIYLVDNDAFHAAGWHKQLMRLWNKHKRITTLFNAGEHSSFLEEGDAVFKKTCGGISMLLNREVISKNGYENFTSGYDWIIPKWWDFVVCSRINYIAHLNISGLHSRENDISLGINPCKYLISKKCDLFDITKKGYIIHQPKSAGTSFIKWLKLHGVSARSSNVWKGKVPDVKSFDDMYSSHAFPTTQNINCLKKAQKNILLIRDVEDSINSLFTHHKNHYLFRELKMSKDEVISSMNQFNERWSRVFDENGWMVINFTDLIKDEKLYMKKIADYIGFKSKHRFPHERKYKKNE